MVREAGERKVILPLPQPLPTRTHHSHMTGFAGARPRERQCESRNTRPRRGKPCPTGGWGDGHPCGQGTAGGMKAEAPKATR